MASNTDAPSSSAQEKPTYADRESRISKENLCMVLALWMERFPLPNDEEKEIDPYRKVGTVLVLPNDMLHAVDCSRNGVHGVARLLVKHYDVAKDYKVFVSRKPCSFCTKLLVQCKVKRVFYLPIEPEYKDLEAFKRRNLTCRYIIPNKRHQPVCVCTVSRASCSSKCGEKEGNAKGNKGENKCRFDEGLLEE